jgi:hypothetical protein
MSDFWNTLLGLPIASILILAGILFLFIAVVGRFREQFDAGKWGRILSGILGGILLIIGLSLYVTGAFITKISHIFH